MADNITLARPYARAVFEIARDGNALGHWSDVLAIAAAAVQNEQLRALLDDPARTPLEQTDLLSRVFPSGLAGDTHNLMHLIAENDRLGVLPEIAERYEALRAEAENKIDVELRSVEPIGEDERAKLASALRARLGREVQMETVIDPSLIGGVVITAGDLVIDGSVRARLDALATDLKH